MTGRSGDCGGGFQDEQISLVKVQGRLRRWHTLEQRACVYAPLYSMHLPTRVLAGALGPRNPIGPSASAKLSVSLITWVTGD